MNARQQNGLVTHAHTLPEICRFLHCRGHCPSCSAPPTQTTLIAGFAYYEFSRHAFYGDGTGGSAWYLRLRLMAFAVAVLCVTFANQLSSAVSHATTRQSRRLFALAVRYWGRTCFRLFLLVRA